jgi:adenylate kinase
MLSDRGLVCGKTTVLKERQNKHPIFISVLASYSEYLLKQACQKKGLICA